MLSGDDFAAYTGLFREVAAGEKKHELRPAVSVLLDDDGQLTSADLLRLARSLSIAVALGEQPPEAAACASIIGQSLRESRSVPFTRTDAWTEAIAWALEELGSSAFKDERRSPMPRQKFVAEACRRLRNKGLKLPLGAFGPEVSRQTCSTVGRGIDSLARLLGGKEILQRVFSNLQSEGRYYDGFWLFGDIVPNVQGAKRPSLPWGYLISLGLKHAGSRPRARKPDVAWASIVRDATDLAAVLDCERYNQFDGMFVSPSDFFHAIQESLSWRETFSLPQVPGLVVGTLHKAFNQTLTDTDRAQLTWSVDNLFNESAKLLDLCRPDRSIILSREEAARAFPNLVREALGVRGKVNRNYVDPLGATDRDQDRTFFSSCRTQACWC